MSDFYLARTLLIDGQPTTEEELISQYKVIIILSEPGAGKTSLLKSLARKLGGIHQRANSLIQELTHPKKHDPLVIDALDECFFSHPSDIDKLWKVAKDAQPAQLIVACRGSEWNKSYNQGLEEIFGAESNNHTITIAKIVSFSYEEKRKLFTYHYPCLSFDAFYSHLEKTNATNFLDNPQMLMYPSHF
ncbi:hypothetical protein [Pelistega europaea]|uniref:NACHT domain-containing protein n=1 Tax=Pelistega europaea TaxID=106147 RepID=A0A7Y4LE52_9BURK|nr:hypothetical protein [Pelistega europaea]NOL50546.1 hypothetical protein [Pelistega europaea]